ncbi:hypothetical protein DE146DRAFT_5565 [Phaeosphaeria sp. MPI-PUGE-AT-0046c]|nr:hypothetical protein DE146DRAFT_5565 [Phaeosphaeria sp. MPI-PUGE-AT-0046c]
MPAPAAMVLSNVLAVQAVMLPSLHTSTSERNLLWLQDVRTGWRLIWLQISASLHPDPRLHVLILRDSTPTNMTNCLFSAALVCFLTAYPSFAVSIRLASPLDPKSIRGSKGRCICTPDFDFGCFLPMLPSESLSRSASFSKMPFIQKTNSLKHLIWIDDVRPNLGFVCKESKICLLECP